MGKLNIVDTTLRDGEQTAGVIFTLEEKISIAKALDELGVEVIEAGIPAMGREEMEGVNRLLALNLNSEIMTWNRIVQDDVLKSIECGARYLHISAPVSDIHIYKKLGKDRKWILNETKKTINFARSKGCKISLGAEDSSRADFDFLLDFYSLGESLGVERIRYADTVSALDPISTYETMKKIKEQIKLPIDFHGHNDFGSATGNSLGALKAGVEFISCSINGLGERAGNTPLEEIVMGAIYLLHFEQSYDIKKLESLSKMVENYSGRRVSEMKAVVGSAVFSHESGIHVDGMLKEERTYQLLNPKDIGRERKIIIGKHTGTSGIINRYKEKGYEIDEFQAKNVVQFLRRELETNKNRNIEDLLTSYVNKL